MDGDELARARARLRLLRVRKSCVSRHCPSKDPRDVWMNTEIVKRNTEMIHKPRKKTYERNNNDDEFKNSKWRESKKKTTRKIFSPVRNGSINHGDYFFFSSNKWIIQEKKRVRRNSIFGHLWSFTHTNIYFYVHGIYSRGRYTNKSSTCQIENYIFFSLIVYMAVWLLLLSHCLESFEFRCSKNEEREKNFV